MKKACIAVAAAFMLSLPVHLTGEEHPSVELAGLRIVGPGHGLNGTELRAFYQESGTTLAFIVRAPADKQIVEVDDSKCALTVFTDDRGRNLLDGVDWSGFPKISEDARLALIEVSSKTRPSPDATRVRVEGTIHMRAAASSVTETVENLTLDVGTTRTVRQETIEVMKAEAENDGLTLVLQISREFSENMKDIRFFTAEGNLLEIWSRGSFTFGNAAQMEYNLEIAAKPEALKVEIDLWQELENLNLPFEIESGIGF